MTEPGYFAELKRNWAPLLAATIGLAGGTSINAYAQSIFAPLLIAEFGWARSHYAFVGMASMIALILIPLAGRCTDLWGTRRTVLPAIVLFPFGWTLYLLNDGSLTTLVILGMLHLVVGSFTTSVVYSRIIAEYFVRSRGLALAIMMSGPAFAGAVGTPLLTAYAADFGWRSGYLAMAGFSAVTGAVAYLLLMIRSPGIPHSPLERKQERKWSDYRVVFSSGTFWIIFIALSLCNIPNVLHTTQMNLMLLDRGADPATSAVIISTFAIGVIIGRFACGVALDRLPIVPVAVVAMILPAIGLFMLAANVGDWRMMAFSMALVGLSQGAEGDIGAMLTLKYFDVKVYGTVFGLIASNAVLSTALGAGLLGLTLSYSDSFTLFLQLGGVAILVGSLMLTLLTRRPAEGRLLAAE